MLVTPWFSIPAVPLMTVLALLVVMLLILGVVLDARKRARDRAAASQNRRSTYVAPHHRHAYPTSLPDQRTNTTSHSAARHR